MEWDTAIDNFSRFLTSRFVAHPASWVIDPLDLLQITSISIENGIDLRPKGLASRLPRVNCLASTIEEQVNAAMAL